LKCNLWVKNQEMHTDSMTIFYTLTKEKIECPRQALEYLKQGKWTRAFVCIMASRTEVMISRSDWGYFVLYRQK